MRSLSALVLLSVAVSASAQTAGTQDTIITQENAFWKAYADANTADLSKLFLPEFINVEEQLMTRDQVLAFVGQFHQRCTLAPVKLLDPHVVFLSADIATQDAIATCNLYGIRLTEALCQCLLTAVGDLRVAQYKGVLQAQAQGIADVKIPLHVRAERARNLTCNRFPIMKHIRVMVESTRIADEKARLAMTAPKQKPGDTYNYNQHIVQHGGVMNASQTGNISAQQLTVGELGALMPALAEVRSVLKKQSDFADADEQIGLLASAEKAAGEGNESKMLDFLKQIPEKTWEIGKALISETLLAYLKARGIIPG